jgi:hypothetical protein
MTAFLAARLQVADLTLEAWGWVQFISKRFHIWLTCWLADDIHTVSLQRGSSAWCSVCVRLAHLCIYVCMCLAQYYVSRTILCCINFRCVRWCVSGPWMDACVPDTVTGFYAWWNTLHPGAKLACIMWYTHMELPNNRLCQRCMIMHIIYGGRFHLQPGAWLSKMITTSGYGRCIIGNNPINKRCISWLMLTITMRYNTIAAVCAMARPAVQRLLCTAGRA